MTKDQSKQFKRMLDDLMNEEDNDIASYSLSKDALRNLLTTVNNSNPVLGTEKMTDEYIEELV